MASSRGQGKSCPGSSCLLYAGYRTNVKKIHEDLGLLTKDRHSLYSSKGCFELVNNLAHSMVNPRTSKEKVIGDAGRMCVRALQRNT